MPLAHTSDTLPTHVLAISSSTSQSTTAKSTPPRGPSILSPAHSLAPSTAQPSSSLDASPPSDAYLIPIDAESFFLAFGHDTARTLGAAALTSKWSKAPSPYVRTDRATGARFVTLPVVPLSVSHPPSLPHVLLSAQGIPLPNASSPPSPPPEASGLGASALATYLLPLAAIEEFPAAPEMAMAMARQCTHDALSARLAFNHGVWRNVLALSPADGTLVDIVRVAWNVTSDAVRLQGLQQRKRSPLVELSAPPPQAHDRPAPSSRIPPLAKAVPTGISAPRLPVVEVDYPVDFLAKRGNGARVVPLGETFEKRHTAQRLAPVSLPLESSLRGRGTQAVQF
uniref:N/A n=1 Tax=Ganoderma boninense TaxID=34458 RepID=A0A5K1JT68_9APHY|nr:N/A [Ganoderma boninense]